MGLTYYRKSLFFPLVLTYQMRKIDYYLTKKHLAERITTKSTNQKELTDLTALLFN